MKRRQATSTRTAPGAALRAAAAQVVDAVLVDGRSMKAVLGAAQSRFDDDRDRALLEAIVFAVMRRARRYRGLVDRLLDKPLPARTRPLDSLLLCGLAQLDALGLAPHAAISASVDATRELRQPRLSGLVNAVLRRYLRERESLDREADAAESAHREHPDWLREQFVEDWGEALAGEILDANNRPAPLWLRLRDVAPGQVASDADDRASYVVALDLDDGDWRIPDRPDHAICLLDAGSPARLPGWADGRITVQDGAAQFAAELLNPQPGDRLLDACAAPGGKLAHLLDRQPKLGCAIGLDNDPTRLQRIEENLRRLKLSATLRVADATAAGEWWDGQPFQRILIDAPCSGTGVVRRQPDIKWHRRAADIPALAAQQCALLDALWPLLAAGGRLVYATCSVLQDENARQIDVFLARHPDAVAIDPDLPVGRRSGHGWQILPGEGDLDGFFHAVLARR